MSDGGKGSGARPLSIPREQFGAQFEVIMPRAQRHCPGCGFLPSWCVCTEGGPADGAQGDDAKDGES